MKIGLHIGVSQLGLSGNTYADHALALDFKQGRYRTPLGYSTDLMAPLGPELVTNPSASGTFGNFVTVATLVAGLPATAATYTVSYTIATLASGSVRVSDNVVNGITRNAVGSYTETFTKSTGTDLRLVTEGSGFNGSITNISVRQVPASYTRSGVKAELAASTGLVSFAADVPGIVPGVGYWSRGAVTNLVLRSQEFDNASWSKSASNVSANAATAPDGSLTADMLVEDTTAAVVHNAFQSGAGAAGAHTFSVFAKAGTRNFVVLRLEGTNTFFNLATGSVGTSGAGNTGSIQSVGNGWYRCSITRTLAAATFAVIQMGSADGTDVYTGNGSGSIYLWQAQLVAGTQPGPIIVTAGAAATVGADDLNILDTIVADEDFIFFAVANFVGTAGSVDEALASIGDNTVNDRLVLLRSTATNRLTAFAGAAGVSQSLGTIPVVSHSTGRAAILVRRRAGKFTVVVKSGDTVTAGTEGAAASMPNVTTINVGKQFTTNSYLKSPLEFVGIRRGTFTDAECLEILENA